MRLAKFFCVAFAAFFISGCDIPKQNSRLENAQTTLATLSQRQPQNLEELKQLQEEYQSLTSSVETLSTSIYPWIKDKANSILIVSRDKLAIVTEELDYKKIKDRMVSLGRSSSYDEAIKKAQEILSDAKAFQKSYVQSRWPISEIVVDLESAVASSYQEKFDFDQIRPTFSKQAYNFSDAESAIASLDSFLAKYPKSIMRSFMIEQRDSMEHIKVKLTLNQEFSSLEQLYTAVNNAKTHATKIQGSYLSGDAQTRITQALSKKQDVLSKEIVTDTDALLNQMKTSAITVANRAHPICGNSSNPASVSNERRNEVGSRIEFYREFQVRTSGDFLCGTTYIVYVAIDGYLSVSEETGVNYSVSASRLLGDYKQ